MENKKLKVLDLPKIPNGYITVEEAKRKIYQTHRLDLAPVTVRAKIKKHDIDSIKVKIRGNIKILISTKSFKEKLGDLAIWGREPRG